MMVAQWALVTRDLDNVSGVFRRGSRQQFHLCARPWSKKLISKPVAVADESEKGYLHV